MPGPGVKCATVFVSGRFASQFAIKALSCLIRFSVMSASVLISRFRFIRVSAIGTAESNASV